MVTTEKRAILLSLSYSRYALILYVMKKVSIMEAQHNLSAVLKTVEEGTGVYITRRKRIVAKIVPATLDEEVTFPDFQSRASTSLGGKWTGKSSDAILDETRGER